MTITTYASRYVSIAITLVGVGILAERFSRGIFNLTDEAATTIFLAAIAVRLCFKD